MSFFESRPAVTTPRCCDGQRALLLIAALALAGCTTALRVPGVSPASASAATAAKAPVVATASGAALPARPNLQVPAERTEAPLSATALMLAFSDRVRSLPAPDLAAEITRLGDPGDSAPAQMQLALALSATRAPADLARALGLMQRVMVSQANDAAPIQPLARTLASRYLEQRRVEDDRDRQVQQLREAQRRIDQLNDRLEALRAIERSVTRPNSRPAAVTPVPAPATTLAKPGP